MRCVSPIYINKHRIQVPCGKCGACMKRKISDWTLRCQVEGKKSVGTYFVTLTYAVNPLQLYKKDLQDYFKRLRKAGNSFRYFALGDYGDTFGRPHYHVLFFSQGSRVSEFDIRSLWLSGNRGEYRGFVKVDNVSFGRLSYVVKYGILAKLDWSKADSRTRPFFLMSKGLGKAYLTSQMRWSHVHADRWWFQDGKYKKPLPRYYRDKLFNVVLRERHKENYDGTCLENDILWLNSFVEQGFTRKEAVWKYDEMRNKCSDQYLANLRFQKKQKNRLL